MVFLNFVSCPIAAVGQRVDPKVKCKFVLFGVLASGSLSRAMDTASAFGVLCLLCPFSLALLFLVFVCYLILE